MKLGTLPGLHLLHYFHLIDRYLHTVNITPLE
jgi:hypothetical protein